jgi:hypothetical protein
MINDHTPSPVLALPLTSPPTKTEVPVPTTDAPPPAYRDPTDVVAALARPDGPARLRIECWQDPVIERLGHDPRSTYVERFWLSVLGPSTTWLLRRLAAEFDDEPGGYDLNLGEAAEALGLSSRTGKSSPFVRALKRSNDFGLSRFSAPATLYVRRRLPPLTHRQVARLPESIRREHDAWHQQPVPAPDLETLRHRARRLAVSMVELGEDLEGTERQLHRWRFHPALANDAARFAWDHVESRRRADALGSTEPQAAAQNEASDGAQEAAV